MECVSANFFFFQAEDGIRDYKVTGVQTCALPICPHARKLQGFVADHGTQFLSFLICPTGFGGGIERNRPTCNFVAEFPRQSQNSEIVFWESDDELIVLLDLLAHWNFFFDRRQAKLRAEKPI